MRTGLSDEQKALLAARRDEVAGMLLAVGDPCPGCMKPVTVRDGEFHHVPWRQSDAFSFETDLLLLDPANGVLAHHACHMKEGWDFQVRAALLVWHRAGTRALGRFKKRLERTQKAAAPLAWPPAMRVVLEVMGGARLTSRQACPLCYAYRLYEYAGTPGRPPAPIDRSGSLRAWALCWSCLHLFPTGTSVR